MAYVSQLARDIKDAADARNAICHASWNPITADSTHPLYVAAVVSGAKEPSVFETPVDVVWRDHVAALLDGLRRERASAASGMQDNAGQS